MLDWIDVILQLNLRCLSMRTIASLLRCTGNLNFINSPISHVVVFCYAPTKSEGYSFGAFRASVHPFHSSVHTFCLSGTISQYLLVRFDSFLVQMISTIDSQYPISLVKIDLLTLELLPLF